MASPGGQDLHDGFFCRGAASGHKALALFAEHGFDAIGLCLWLGAVTAACAFILGALALLAACAFVLALGPHALGPFAFPAVAACVFGSLGLRAAAACAFVLGPFVPRAVTDAARAFGSFALASVVLGYLWLCVVAAAHTFVLGILVLPAVATVACAFVLVPSLLVTAAATAGVCLLVLGILVLPAIAQACCFAWIGSSRGGLRPGSLALRRLG